MSYRILQIHTDKDHESRLVEVSKELPVIEVKKIFSRVDGVLYSLLVKTQEVQTITDRLQTILGGKELYRIATIPVETLIPKPPEEEKKEEQNKETKEKKKFLGISREELYEDVARGASLNKTFILLVILSTIVASIGMLEDNVAVVVGAMVIAPLLGPNIALALATALGDFELMKKSLQTNLAGIITCLALAIFIGFIWPYEFDSKELMSRTDVGFSGIVLAIASGAAAVLSLTAGISSVLVGVMVAVALLPPASTMGIMIGSGNYSLALGAALLLAVNIVCVNLSAKLVFFFKGVEPRTWYEKKKAKKARHRYMLYWIISLLILAGIIYLRKSG